VSEGQRLRGLGSGAPTAVRLQFRSTAKASADAHALSRVGLVQFDLVIDAVALVVAVILIASGSLLGVLLIVVAVLSLLGSRFHFLPRAVTAVRFRGILGQTTDVTIDDEGVRLENPLGSSFVPWSTITAVRSNSQTVAFFRDHLLFGYVPASAFASAAAQAETVAFAKARLASGRGPSQTERGPITRSP
jgi:hypothetical protein